MCVLSVSFLSHILQSLKHTSCCGNFVIFFLFYTQYSYDVNCYDVPHSVKTVVSLRKKPLCSSELPVFPWSVNMSAVC